MKNVRTTALLVSLLLVVAGVGALPALAAEEDFLYNPGTVNTIELTLPQAGIEGLEDEPFEYQAGGTVVVTPTDGTPGGKGVPSKTFQNVEIKLKGKPQGSFEDLDHKAAFKLKFKKAEPFFGLRKLTLNNMTQDPSMIHESLAYTAFGAAGVPASRSGYAYVWLNGENYGLHLNLESLDTVSLPKIFGAPFDDETQHLYEANEYGADFYPGKESRFEVDEGEDDTSDLTALIAAVDAAASDPLPPGLSSLVDLDEMTRMWGVEKYIGHWDGYAGEGIPGEEEFNEHRPNNYYLYSDPSGRFSMLPWGTDQTWESYLEFDEQDGRLFDLCLEDETCAGKFSAGVANALEQVGGLDLRAQAAATAAMLAPWQALEEDPRRPYDAAEIATAVDETCDFIAARPAEAEAWLSGGSSPVIRLRSGCSQSSVPPTERPRVVPTPEAGRPLRTVRTLLPQLSFHPRGVSKLGDRIRARFRTDVAGRAVLRGEARIEGERRQVCRDEARIRTAGTLTLVCRLSPRVLERLRHRSLPIDLRVTFTATTGGLELLTRRVTLPRPQ
ncbi:MAG TPA: CotH kinase family protein [Solirubrobacterales bacterium]|nr:CotH kinase family protein [Solirubrobacterales bacterium]